MADCKNLVPSACGNTMPVTYSECNTENMKPHSECIKTELYAPDCEDE